MQTPALNRLAADSETSRRTSSCASSALPCVVHVTGDFPDPIVPRKTPVIRTLLELTSARFAHRVVSLNRRSPQLADLMGRAPEAFDHPTMFEWGKAVIYRAPPHGLFHATMLRSLGDRLAHDLKPAPPALLVGHKLTIEGLVVARAARILGIPYAITIQGNTDTRILAARPDLTKAFAEVFHGAATVFAFAPWALAAVERRLGARRQGTILLPCPTELDEPLTPCEQGNGFVSVFHLEHHRNKNLGGMATALQLLRRTNDSATLEIIGGGSDSDFAQCRAQVSDLAGIQITGPLAREDLRFRLNQATGLVLPSLRESFGLVFVEALFAGLPVIYPAGMAVDGYFDGLPFAIAVDARDPHAIAAAMRRLIQNERDLKRALAEWQGSAHARRFMRPAIAASFSEGIGGALAGAPPIAKGAAIIRSEIAARSLDGPEQARKRYV